MMLNDRRNWRNAEAPITERTTSTLAMMIERGTTAVRSYAQVDVDCGLERLDAVLAARDAHADRADVQVIAFPQAGLLRELGSAELLADALASGADVVGGIDPCALDRDPVRHLDLVFGLAERFSVPIDIHLHEPDQLAKFSTELILERVRALDLRGRVTISHGYGQGFTAEFDWTGTTDPSAWLALPAAIAFFERLGGAALMARNKRLVAEAAAMLASELRTETGSGPEMK